MLDALSWNPETKVSISNNECLSINQKLKTWFSFLDHLSVYLRLVMVVQMRRKLISQIFWLTMRLIFKLWRPICLSKEYSLRSFLLKLLYARSAKGDQTLILIELKRPFNRSCFLVIFALGLNTSAIISFVINKLDCMSETSLFLVFCKFFFRFDKYYVGSTSLS